MVHLNILVEGQTELRFVKSVLAPHLGRIGIYAYPIAVLTSKDKRASKEYRGGVINYRQVRADLLRLIKRDYQNPNAFFTTMIDLYRLPDDFPVYEKARAVPNSRLRVARLEQAFLNDIGCERFLPYIQLHEYEALVLSGPDRLNVYYRSLEHQNAISRLKEMVSEFSSPEEIDDGEASAPSRRIISEIPAYEYDKAHAGPLIVQHIGLPVLRDRCAHFADWLSKLEHLAGKVDS